MIGCNRNNNLFLATLQVMHALQPQSFLYRQSGALKAIATCADDPCCVSSSVVLYEDEQRAQVGYCFGVLAQALDYLISKLAHRGHVLRTLLCTSKGPTEEDLRVYESFMSVDGISLCIHVMLGCVLLGRAVYRI